LARPVTSQRQEPRSSASILLFVLLIAGCVALFLAPAVIIQPFSYQSPRALMWAMRLRHSAPFWTLLFFAVSLFLCVKQWKRVGKLTKGLLALGLVFGAFATVMSRVDYFEWMFHPLPSPGFQDAESARLDPKQMVMAVRFGNDARAYPIRAMAYHHLVNDVVNGTPVVVTY